MTETGHLTASSCVTPGWASLRRGAHSYVGLVGVLGLVLAGSAAHAQDSSSPLPDPDEFLRRVRESPLADRIDLSSYTFVVRQTETPRAKPEDAKTEVFRVFPAADARRTEWQLLSVDGEPVPKEKLEEQDRKRRESEARRARELAKQGLTEREKRRDEWEEGSRDSAEVFDDIIDVFEFRLVRREMLDGHSAIVVTATPRPAAKPRTREGKILKKARGQLWISERDHKVMRAEVETLEDVTVGLGLVGRLHKGSNASVQFRKIDDEIWLPHAMRLRYSGRRFLFRTFDLETVLEYSEHQKRWCPTRLPKLGSRPAVDEPGVPAPGPDGPHARPPPTPEFLQRGRPRSPLKPRSHR